MIYIPLACFFITSILTWKLKPAILKWWNIEYGRTGSFESNQEKSFCWLTPSNSILIGVYIPATCFLSIIVTFFLLTI
jgi:hypothetical protein